MSHIGLFWSPASKSSLRDFNLEIRGQALNFCKSACDGTLPKILLTDGLVPFNFIRFIVVTDYDYIEKAFRKRELSSRLKIVATS